MSLVGKKLLLLGADDSGMGTKESDIVRHAQAMGVYVIVTDNQADWDKAPAKKIADEAWDISWSDTEALSAKCRESGIDGVFAALSERKVSCAARLCDVLGLPFYANGADTRTIFNKNLFKDACLSVGVEVPKRYSMGDPVEYPVVVKPVDNAGSRGISVCFNDDELDRGIEDALAYSTSGLYEIEDFVDGDEAFFYYLVSDGEAIFAASSDLITISPSKKSLPVPIANRYPSKHEEAFVKNNDEKFQKLIFSLGIRNGIIGFQCFVKDGRVLVHDPTFRVDGSDVYRILKREKGVDTIDLMLRYSLTGSMGERQVLDALKALRWNTLYLGFAIALRKGVVGKVEGLDSLSQVDGVYDVTQFRKLCCGDVIDDAVSLRSLLLQVVIRASDKTGLRKAVASCLSRLSIEDESGNDMVVCPSIELLIPE